MANDDYLESRIHYYGDIVRIIFLSCGMLMLIGFPFLHERIPVPFYFSIGGILGVVFFAGLTNPKQKLVAVADMCMALCGAIIFEYYAVMEFDGLLSLFFWVNQILAVFFLVAFYYSTKTVRGFLLSKK